MTIPPKRFKKGSEGGGKHPYYSFFKIHVFDRDCREKENEPGRNLRTPPPCYRSCNSPDPLLGSVRYIGIRIVGEKNPGSLLSSVRCFPGVHPIPLPTPPPQTSNRAGARSKCVGCFFWCPAALAGVTPTHLWQIFPEYKKRSSMFIQPLDATSCSAAGCVRLWGFVRCWVLKPPTPQPQIQSLDQPSTFYPGFNFD